LEEDTIGQAIYIQHRNTHSMSIGEEEARCQASSHLRRCAAHQKKLLVLVWKMACGYFPDQDK